MPGSRLESDDDLRDLLRRVRTIAVVGLSPRPQRPSHGVSAYMQAAGYRIVPVRPGVERVLGETAYPALTAIPITVPIDLVNVFRRPDALPALVAEAAAAGMRVLWLQLGVVHPRAEAEALERGVDLVADRCLLVEHRRLLGDRRRDASGDG
jgi:predicted CoA-binding protein